jgi:hypothetical protein
MWNDTMGTAPYTNLRARTFCLVLALCLFFLQSQAQAARSSELSRWLSATLAPQLAELLANHPRYRGRSVAVFNQQGGNALADAVAVVLRSHLAGQGSIALVSNETQTAPIAVDSVDDLACLQVGPGDLQLRVAVVEDGSGGDRVSVALVETGAGNTEAPRLWQWAGTLTRAERSRARQARASMVADGSLDSPWTEADIEAAAMSLSRDFACRLRPAIATRVRLQWDESEPLPPLFRDTINTSRHLLGSYRELALTQDRGDYLVVSELRPFRGDIFQLWLTGRPRAPLRDPVQAVAYFRAAGLAWPPVPAKVPPTPPAGSPKEYLQVEMLGAHQSDRGRAGAELRVALRLVNRAEWPIAYGLRLSGGHFMHCIARPSYYRHDRYGTLTGTLAPGGSAVRDLVVGKLRHTPLPWFGPARCAGSTDLEALESYAIHGYRVTDYVRWDM